MKSAIFGLALIIASAAPANAQGRDVSRRAFNFYDDDVTIEVQADAPGTLHVVRGEYGRLEAVGRVPGGLSTFALGGRSSDRLRLTAVGGDKADFIVVVPEDAFVRVLLPNRKSGALSTSRSGAAYTWGGAVAQTGAGAALLALRPSGPVIAHSTPYAPATLSIPKITTVRSIRVRIQGSAFEVGGDHHMSVVNGGGSNVEVRTGNEPEQLVVNVPADTRNFTLRLGGRTALVIRDLEVWSYCEPVIEQTMPGARWFTYSPESGRLTCR